MVNNKEYQRILRIQDAWNYAMRVYQYRQRLLRGAGLPESKIRTWSQVLWRVFIQKKKMLFLPEKPKSLFIIYKILFFLGIRITDDASVRVHAAMNWLNALDGSPFLPHVPVLVDLFHSESGGCVLNADCRDVSKKQVSAVFEKIFGYALAVNPQTFEGRCVMKSDWNGLHVGTILECPVPVPNPEFVYQKLIDNEVENGIVEDIRVPIMKGTIPFVYIKRRAIDHRLVDRKHTAKNAMIRDPSDYLSREERENILRFCDSLGLDYGEIDVLRDREDGRIYIVDVNNNPAGPPEALNQQDANLAVIRLAKAFEEACRL
jgi:hypothetical protein